MHGLENDIQLVQPHYVEVRGLEPLTPCMPSTQGVRRRISLNSERVKQRTFAPARVRQDSESFEEFADVFADVESASQRILQLRTSPSHVS